MSCILCPLHKQANSVCISGTAGNTIGLEGQAIELMVYGEAPGATEDKRGLTFVGKSGKFLRECLTAILEDTGNPFAVSLHNVVKCRPPKNRDPLPEEFVACRAYSLAEIELVRPKRILCVGRIAGQALVHGSLAGPGILLREDRYKVFWQDFGDLTIPISVTYHPAFIQRNRREKDYFFEDLARVIERIASRKEY